MNGVQTESETTHVQEILPLVKNSQSRSGLWPGPGKEENWSWKQESKGVVVEG